MRGKTWALAVIAGLLTATAYILLWSTFKFHDDEGYVLFSIREFINSGGLYDVVYTQYGPFYYLLFAGCHKLGLVFTNTTGRELTLVYWLGASALCAAIVWRASGKSTIATAVTIVAVFLHLRVMTDEPSHPGGFIALLVAVGAWAGTHPRWSARGRGGWIGAITAMLLLTKINVGIFYATSVGAWWLLGASNHRPWARWGAVLGPAALPVLLMASSLADPWVRTYAIVAAIGIVDVIISAPRSPSAATGFLTTAALFMAGVIGACLVLVLITGTSVSGLVDGLILNPTKQPLVYSLPVNWPKPARLVAAATLLMALAVPHLKLSWIKRAIVGGRILTALGYGLTAANILPGGVARFSLCFGLLAAWFFVYPATESNESQPVRTWLALEFVLQCLHAYPVAGSQASWGTFLFVSLLVVGIHDLRAIVPVPNRRPVAVGFAFATAGVFAQTAVPAWWRFSHYERLELHGAENIRQPESICTAAQMLVRNAQTHGNLLFTLPGMMSFNLWSGTPPPTAANATLWFSLLAPSQQEAIQRRLESSPRAVLIVERQLYRFVQNRGLVVETPLLRWLLTNFQPAFGINSYEFWVRKGRKLAIVDSACLYNSRGEAPLKYRIEITAVIPAGQSVAAIELRRFEHDRSVPVTEWSAANARFTCTAIAPDGNSLGPTIPAPPPIPASHLVRIDVYTSDFPADFPMGQGMIALRGSTGDIIERARFIN